MTALPASPVAANGGSTTFQLVFEPTVNTGLRTATVTIANDDPGKNPYTFKVQGTAQIQPRIDPSLEYNNVESLNGDRNPTVTKGTDFANVDVGLQSSTHLFQFYNYGTVDMILTGNKAQLSGANAGDFAIVSMPSSPIAPNQFSTIGIRFQPTASGLRSADMQIYFDPTYGLGATSPYTVALQGTGAQNKVTVTVQANPSGPAFTVDGTTYTSAQNFSWTPGSTHTIATTSPQSQYVWKNWSDSGAISHTVAPTSDTTYTANFEKGPTQATITVLWTPSEGGAATGGGTFDVGSQRQISATPAAGGNWTFKNWNDGNTQNPRTVTVPSGGATYTANFERMQPPTRTLRVVSATGSPGATVSLPIELKAEGNENALGFSVSFSTIQLAYVKATAGSDAASATLNENKSQAGSGVVGIALALPSGQAFPAGARQVVVLTFTVASSLPDAAVCPVGFGNTPVAREVSSATAETLPATYVDGNITVQAGFEADVTPRPNGNGAVTITDWVLVGRFAAGLDTAAAGSEFSRADCAPRSSLGNGAITVTDWVQAGRYAAGLDPLTAAGGPSSPVVGAALHLGDLPSGGRGALSAAAVSRVLRVRDASTSGNTSITIPVEIDAAGDENAIGFSIGFDPAKLTFNTASLGAGGAGANLNVNSLSAASGKIGIALAKTAGQTLASGTLQLVNLTFTTATVAATTSSVLSFGNTPVFREVSDALANDLPASYQDGTVTIQPKPGPFTLTITPTANGHVTRDPDQAVYSSGAQVLLTAVPDQGYLFSGWSGDASGNANPLFVTLDANKTISAIFSKAPSFLGSIVAWGNNEVWPATIKSDR